MPRQPRQTFAGVTYHVLNRAAGRATLFRRHGDYLAFCLVLKQAVAREMGQNRVPPDLLSWVVMPNHWHLVLRPHEDHSLSEFVRWLTVTHTQRYHAAHRTGGTGPLYQGRFKSFPVQDDGHLLSLIRYVERNPVRANLVGRADGWRWGSSGDRTARTPLGPPLLPMDRWPVEHGWTPATWPRHVDEAHTAAELAALRTTLARGRPLGENPWREQAAARHGLDATLRPLGRPRKEPHAPKMANNGT